MKKLNTFLVLFVASITMFAQKPALDHSVYDSWKSLRGITLPQNGDVLMYAVAPQEGDSELVIENIRTNKKVTVPRATRAVLSQDFSKVIAVIKAEFKQTREAKIKKTKRENMPKDTLAIIDVATGEVTQFANYKSHNLPDKLFSHIAFELTPKKDDDTKEKKAEGKKAEVKEENSKPEAKGAPSKEGGKKPGKKEEIKELYVMNIASGKVDTLKNVTSCKFNKEGDLMAYIYEPGKKDTLNKYALKLYNTATGESKTVLEGEKGSKIKLPVFSEVGTMAFYANTDTSKAAKKKVDIYLYDISSGKLNIAAHNKMAGLKEGWIVSENGALSFSKDGGRLFFGTAPKPKEKDTTLVDFEQPQLDIWTWNEDYLQPVQLLRKERELKQTYTAYINTSLTENFVQLGTLDIPTVSVPNEKMADWAIVSNDKKYRIQSQWDYSRTSDLYLMNIKDGSVKLIKEGVCYSGMTYSPKGDYAITFDKVGKNWLLYSIATGKITNLTENMNVSFVDDEHDTPSLAGANGHAIWFEDGTAFVIRDKFDYWKFNVENVAEPAMFTNDYGRTNNTQLSVTVLIEDPDKSAAPGRKAEIKSTEPLYFTTFNKTSKQTGLAIKDITKKKSSVTKIVEGPYTYGNFKYSKPGKGKKAAYIYSRGNFEEGNNAFITYDNFKTQKQITDINPQQRDYNWGTVELVNWRTEDDIFCEGLLFKPEDFDSTKKYPVMIYFYEKESDNLYASRVPSPSRSVINIPYFTSNGYVVFVPDIYYKDGHPGKSAMRSIMPGVKMLEESYPWIDGKNMAIQGQSWGGYQVAYMITQTNKFKAAGAGAPVSNMTSAYGGIRWGSGITRQVQYEQGQSRIGKDLWSGFDLYYENSPLFFAPNVTTPVLIMHNDKDGAVPWYQGIEFFVGLRRLGKVAWMLQYNNEEHNLVERKNCKDLSIRLSQFFDHYLKGAPMPKWMKNGRPAVDKGYDLGYDLIEE